MYFGKNRNILPKQPPVTERRQNQDIMKQAPGIMSAVLTSTNQAFISFIAEVMIDLVVETNRKGSRKVDKWNMSTC